MSSDDTPTQGKPSPEVPTNMRAGATCVREWTRTVVAMGFNVLGAALAGSVLALVGLARVAGELGATWRWLAGRDEAPPTPTGTPKEYKGGTTSCPHPSPPSQENFRQKVDSPLPQDNLGRPPEEWPDTQPQDCHVAMHAMLDETDEEFDRRMMEHYRQALRRTLEQHSVFDIYDRSARGGSKFLDGESAGEKNSAEKFRPKWLRGPGDRR